MEVIAKLREKFRQEIPAIVLTGDISTQTLRSIASLGCTHLDKPVETTANSYAKLWISSLAPKEIAKPRQCDGAVEWANEPRQYLLSTTTPA